MCGIIAAINTNGKPVNDWVITQLEDQIGRGREGFGITYFDGKKLETRRATELTKCMIDLYMRESSHILLHHRYPTSTPNKCHQTHPINVRNEELDHHYQVIHNGIIRNDDDLKEAHEKLGYVYTTAMTETKGSFTYEKFNDSEAAAIDVARFVDGKSKKLETVGSAAIIGIRISKKTGKTLGMFFIRNDGNPLHFSMSRGQVRLSSEGMGENIKPNKLYELNLKDMKLKKRACELKTSIPVTTYPTATPSLTPVLQTSLQKLEEIKEDKKEKEDTKLIGYETDYPAYAAGYESAWRDDIEIILEAYFDSIEDWQQLVRMDGEAVIDETIESIRDSLRSAYNDELMEYDEAELERTKSPAKTK